MIAVVVVVDVAVVAALVAPVQAAVCGVQLAVAVVHVLLPSWAVPVYASRVPYPAEFPAVPPGAVGADVGRFACWSCSRQGSPK